MNQYSVLLWLICATQREFLPSRSLAAVRTGQNPGNGVSLGQSFIQRWKRLCNPANSNVALIVPAAAAIVRSITQGRLRPPQFMWFAR
jgi:hypothetical protein